MLQWKEKQTEKGVLKYRLPNISEGYHFLAAIQKITNARDVFTVKGDFIAKMGPMVDFKSLNYDSYEEFLNDRDNNMIPMSEIADEVFVEITKALGKKN
jgi:hypothetical protein